MDIWITGVPVPHMTKLRRRLDHRSPAFGLSRFACQAAFVIQEKDTNAGEDLPPLGCRMVEGRALGIASPNRTGVQFCAIPSACLDGAKSSQRGLMASRSRQQPRAQVCPAPPPVVA